MRLHLQLAFLGMLLIGSLNLARAQAPISPPEPQNLQIPATSNAPEPLFRDPGPTADSQMAGLAQDAANLQQQQAANQAAPTPDIKKQLDLLQKQIETQQKMIQLLMEQVK
jgi:hypothetical protein